MTKSQWAAVYVFCEENRITKYELLKLLKENGTVDRNARLDDLGEYTGGSYSDMMQFLWGSV